LILTSDLNDMNDLHLHNALPDFWDRQANVQTETFEFAPCGIRTRVTANRPPVLAAARLSAGRFSQSEKRTGEPIWIQIVVGNVSTEPVPADLPERLVYTGVGDWITLSAGTWGHGFANLSTRQAVIILSPALAADIRLVSRYFLDHYLLNFILTEWAMLHASCVLDPGRQQLVVMIAPHNTGKSTTALHLLRAGYHFLADGMALFKQRGADFVVGGYPIGEVKLRDDVLSLFPEYSGPAVKVREHHKTVVNLRSDHSAEVVEALVCPSTIHLCFVQRGQTAQTRLIPLSPEAAQSSLVLADNTVYWNEPDRLAHNTVVLETLFRVANNYILQIGTDPTNIIASLKRIM
jgi:hypothetical protein